MANANVVLVGTLGKLLKNYFSEYNAIINSLDPENLLLLSRNLIRYRQSV